MNMAIISLAPGQCGFYDNISGIHLSLVNKEAKVPHGANTTGLCSAVLAGKIIVVSGSLTGPETFSYKEDIMTPTYYRLLKQKQQKKVKKEIMKTIASEPQKEIEKEVITTEVELEVNNDILEVVEEPMTETIEEVVVEEPKEEKKKRTRKPKKVEVKED